MQFLFVALCAFLIAACSGQSFEQDGGDLTRGEIELLSAKLREAIEKEFPIIKHKLVNRYVNTLGQSIISRNPDMPPLPYEFRVLRSNEVFGFSLPGGIIYISLGMLRTAEMEGQLAAALAHELAHQQLNHPLVVWRRKVNTNRNQRNLLDFSGDWKESFLGKQGALYLERDMEEEADKLAPVILFRAHFEPRLYTSYLQLLRKLELNNTAQVAMVLSLHPPIVERMNWSKDGLNRLPPIKDSSLSSASFQELKAILKETAKKAEAGGKKKEVP